MYVPKVFGRHGYCHVICCLMYVTRNSYQTTQCPLLPFWAQAGLVPVAHCKIKRIDCISPSWQVNRKNNTPKFKLATFGIKVHVGAMCSTGTRGKHVMLIRTTCKQVYVCICIYNLAISISYMCIYDMYMNICKSLE